MIKMDCLAARALSTPDILLKDAVLIDRGIERGGPVLLLAQFSSESSRPAFLAKILFRRL